LLTDCAVLAIVAADWLAQVHPRLGNTAAVADAALRAAATSTLKPDTALRYGALKQVIC